MKRLVVYYSRTGFTKKVGELISNEINCDFEEIYDRKKRSGILGYIRAGRDAKHGKLTVIKEIEKNPQLYELIILGTPVWNKRVSSPIRTYIAENYSKFKNVAFFCTAIKKGGQDTLALMAKLCNKTPVLTLELVKKEIKKGFHTEKISKFTRELQNIIQKLDLN